MNRKLSIISTITAAAFLAVTALSGGAQDMPKIKTNAGFEQLKSLVGSWEGTGSDGKSATLKYEVVSNGTAILERLHPHDELEMVTMYSVDGTRLSVKHYCSVGNQPQMQTEPLSGPAQKYIFNYVSATNLAKESDGHMTQLILTFADANHLTQEWNFSENGKVTHSEIFHFTRKS